MAKLYYRYGAMGSSKTANALMVKYNYEERGQNVLLTKPAVDTRDGVHKIVSRCGLESECTLFEDINEAEIIKYDCIIVDEAQFLSKDLKALRGLALSLSREGTFQQEGQQMLRPKARVGLTYSSHIENTNMAGTE